MVFGGFRGCILCLCNSPRWDGFCFVVVSWWEKNVLNYTLAWKAKKKENRKTYKGTRGLPFVVVLMFLFCFFVNCENHSKQGIIIRMCKSFFSSNSIVLKITNVCIYIHLFHFVAKKRGKERKRRTRKRCSENIH